MSVCARFSPAGGAAYTSSESGTVVLAGARLITERQTTFSGPLTTDLLRKMAPHLS